MHSTRSAKWIIKNVYETCRRRFGNNYHKKNTNIYSKKFIVIKIIPNRKNRSDANINEYLDEFEKGIIRGKLYMLQRRRKDTYPWLNLKEGTTCTATTSIVAVQVGGESFADRIEHWD